MKSRDELIALITNLVDEAISEREKKIAVLKDAYVDRRDVATVLMGAINPKPSLEEKEEASKAMSRLEKKASKNGPKV